MQNKSGAVRVATHDQPITDVEVSAPGANGNDVVTETRIDHAHTDGRHRILVEVPGRGDLWRSWRRRGHEVLVTVRLPEGAAIEVETAAGDVVADGAYGTARLRSASGRVWVECVRGDLVAHNASGSVAIGSVGGEAAIRTASGDVRCEILDGPGDIKTASGDATVGAAHLGLRVFTASGDVSVGDLAGDGTFKTASGDQRIGRLLEGRADLDTVTGDLTIGVVRGALVAVEAQTVSGTLDSEIELDASAPPDATDEGPYLALRARTVSGDLQIRRAAPA